MKKILICGGHLSPAVAFVETLKTKQVEIVFVGRKTELEGGLPESRELEVMRDLGIRARTITAGRLTRVFGAKSIMAALKIPIGFLHALVIIAGEKPDSVVSFGGYVALPVAVAAWIFGIPVVTHEQTLRPGLATRVIALFAKAVAVTFPETQKEFPPSKTYMTGLPLRQSLFHPPDRPSFDFSTDKPILYLTGGTTGSTSLNALLWPIIPKLTLDFTVIHQTGYPSLERARLLRKDLPEEFRSRYVVAQAFDVSDVAWILRHACCAVSRSGINTVMEFSVFGVPVLLVPLPWSAAGEQQENALWLERRGLARVLAQNLATPEKIVAAVRALSCQNEQKNPIARKPIHDVPVHAARELVKIVFDIMGQHS